MASRYGTGQRYYRSGAGSVSELYSKKKQPSTTAPVSQGQQSSTRSASAPQGPTYTQIQANPVVSRPTSAIQDAVQKIDRLAKTGAPREQITQLWDALEADTQTPGTAYYNAYFKPTSKAAQELTSLGIQLPDKIDEDWLSDAGAFIATYQRNTATGVTAAAPTKSSTAEQNTAYWLSRFLEDYDTTQAAKNESLALERELSYWIGRGYSDDAAIAKIDYADYPTLAKMREAQTVGEPLQLTEALPFSDDWLYAKAWAARNPDTATGDYMTDLMQMGMGRGVSYKPDPQSDAARDPSNAETYNPYMFGATNDGLRMKYGVDSWDMDWLEQNRSMLNDEATADDWRTMYDAAQNTDTARAELETLQTEILAKIGRGKSFEEVFNDKFMNGFATDYPTLAKMEDYRYRGTSIELSDSVDFAMPYFKEWVRDKIEERDAGIRETNDTIAADSEAAAAAAASTNPKTKMPEAAISDLEADMRLMQRAGMKLTEKAITPEALNAINALLPVSITSKDAAARINEAMANGEELNIGKIFSSSGATANTKPMSATNTFTADDTLAELAGLKERALVGINVNPDKLPASVQGVIDDAFMEELTNAIRTDDEMAIRRLFDEAAQSVQDAAAAPAPGETRAEGAAPQPVKVTTLVEDLQALKRRALSGEGIPIAALSETLLGAMQAATGFDADALNAEMQNAVETGDMAALVGWIDQTTAMLSEQVAQTEPPAEQGMERGNVDLNNRPQVPDSALVEAGWMEPGEASGSYATVYSTFFTAGNRKKDDGFREAFGMQKDYQADKEMIVHVTPILSDGNVLTPEELEDYVRSAIDSGDVMAYDAEHNNIVLAVDDVSKAFNWREAWQSAEEYDEALHVEQEKLYSQQPDAKKSEPVKKWDWADYYTKQSTMSATDFTRYKVEIQDGLLEYLKTGETKNAGALSFLDSFGDLFEGDRWGADAYGRNALVDVRKKYGGTMIEALDAINKKYADPYDYVGAVMAAAAAYDEAIAAPPTPEVEELTARYAELQRGIDAGEILEINDPEAFNVAREGAATISAAQADAYFEANPDALAPLAAVADASNAAAEADAQAKAQAREQQIADAKAEYEANLEAGVPKILDAYNAVAAGTATEEQAGIAKAARSFVTDTSRASDDTYQKIYRGVREIVLGGYNPENAAVANFEESTQYATGNAAALLAMNPIDDHLGIAASYGLTLAELYDRYPEMYISPKELAEQGLEEYSSNWLQFGNGLAGMADAAQALVEKEVSIDIANQYDPMAAARAGIGTLPAIGMGIESGVDDFKLNWMDVADAYLVQGLSQQAREFEMRNSYANRAEAYSGQQASIGAAKDAEVQNAAQTEFDTSFDVYASGDGPRIIRLHDLMAEKNSNLEAAQKFIAENGTSAELGWYNFSTAATSSSMMAATYMAGSALTGAGAMTGIAGTVARTAIGTFSFGIPTSPDFVREVNAKTGNQGAAIISGLAYSIVDGWFNQFQFSALPGFGPIDDSVGKTLAMSAANSLAIKNPGLMGRCVNAFTLAGAIRAGRFVGEGSEEVAEKIGTEYTKSLILYGLTGEWQEPDLSGLENEFLMGGAVASLMGEFGNVVTKGADVVTGNRAQMRFDQAAILGAAVDGMAAKNLSIDIANGALNPILQGPEAANLTKAEADLVNARVIFADTQTTIAEQARLQADAEATFLNDVTEENLAVWDSATEALEAAQANLEGAQSKVTAAEQGVQNAKGILDEAIATQLDQIRAKARQDAESALKDKNIGAVVKATTKDIDTAKAKLEALDPKSPARAVLAAQIDAMEASKAASDFEAKNVGALMKPGTKRGEAARAQFDSLQAAKKAAQNQLTKLTDPTVAAQETLDAALKQYREGTAPSDMIALQGVKVAQLGVNLANAEKAYAQTQEALRNATGNYISADFSGRAPVDIGGLLSANDTAKASLDSARAAYNTQKTAMRSAVTDVVTDTLAKSDSDLAQQIADAIAANDRQGVENLLAEAADAGILGFQGKPAATKAETQPVTAAPITAPIAPVNAATVTASETIGDLTPAPALAAPAEPVTAEPVKAPYKPEHLIQNRARDTVGARNMRAFSNDFEEFKNVYGAAASILLFDLKATQKGQKIVIPVEGYDPDAKGGLLWSGQSRITSALLAEILDSGTENKRDWTYAGLESALLDFARAGEDGSAVPDDAAHKKLELFLHKMLTEGYEALDGTYVNPSFEYEVLVSEISGTPLTMEREQEIFAKQSERMNGVGVFEYAENPLGSVAEMADELMSGGEKAMDIAFRIATKGKGAPSQGIDAEYMAAANMGDTETAQRMVDGAAKAAGYTIKAYHGTGRDFTVFKTNRAGKTIKDTIGSHFGTEKAASDRLKVVGADATVQGGGERLMSVYLKIDSPLLKKDGNIMNETELNAFLKRIATKLGVSDGDMRGGPSPFVAAYVGDLVGNYLKEQGYDGIPYINSWEDRGSTSYIVFSPEQIKYANAITADDSGNIIPLSQRFNLESNDIRFRKGGSGVAATVPNGSTVNPGTPSGRIRNPVQIARSLIKALGVGDYIGAGNMNAGAQVTIPQTAQGYYVNRANYIVANRENAASFATTMHEAGHALSAKLGLDATDDMVNALPQALKDAYPESEWRGEAFAEFVYDYMLNGRESAVKNAGADFVNTFEEALRTNKLYDIVNEHAIAAREYVSSDADTKIRAVVVDVPPKADKEGFWTKAISRYVDSTRAIAPLDEAIGNAVGLSIRQQARYRTFRERMAVANLDKVGTDANGNIVGKSMAQTIEDTGIHGRDFNTLTDYMVAKHALDLMNRDEPITVLPDTITRAELEQLITDVESKNKVVADGAKAINAWWNAFMQRWFVDTGLLSQQEFDAMTRKNPHYVPLMRAYEDSGAGSKRGSSYKLTFIKSGSVEIANPFNSYAKIVREIGRLVAQNEVARAVHEAYQSNPGLGAFMRDVTPATRLPSAKAQAQAEIDEHASALGNPTGENPYAKFVVEGLRRSSLDPSTRILRGVDRDGKVFQYEIAHGQDELMQVLGSPASAKTGLEGIGRLTRIMSMLITGKNILWATRNAVRDIQSSINYGSWAMTIFDGIPKWIAAMTDVIANKDSYKQYVAMGGGGYSFLTSGTTKGNAEYRADLFKGSTDQSAGGMARYGGQKALKIATFEWLNEAVEQTSRYAEFKYGKADAKGKYDRTTTEGRQRMLLSAQDVTVDFTLAGNSQAYRAIKQVVPFFGPSVQGVYRAFRMFSPEERGRLVPRLVKTIFNYSLRAAAQYALLSMLADDDDWDEYARLDDVYKAKHLFIPVKRFGGDDEGGMLAVKLPTSEDPVSRALYTLALWGVGQSSDKFSLDIMATVSGNIRDILPDGSIFSPLLDVKNNQTYLGTPIVSQSLETRTGIDQYEDDTARSFVGLAKIMYDLTGGAANISPEKLQYLAEQYSGVLGQLAIPLMGTIGQADGAWYQRLWTDTSRQFMTDTTYSNRYGNLFYQNRDAFTEIIKAGDTGGVASDLNPHLTDAERKQAYLDAKALTSSGGAFNTASKNVAALYAEIDANNTNASLTWAQRRDLNGVLRERINDEYNIANAEAEKYFGQYGIDRGIAGRIQVIAGGGSDAQKLTAPTKIETLPDVFQGDVAAGADYIARSEELIAENPTLTTVYPNPPRTFKDEGVEYTVGDDAWDDFTQTYYDTYIDYVEGISDDDWANMDNEARVEFYRDAHREASDDAKRNYLMYYA